MKLREVTVRNFRCLVDVTVPIDDTTILVGENNSGKSAFIDALTAAIPRYIASRDTVFDEYDYHMSKTGDSPQTCEGIVIELWFREDENNEWVDPLKQSLDNIIQTDPTTGLNSIGLRLSSKHDAVAGNMVTKWEFLNSEGQALGGLGARSDNLSRFLVYIRLFYISALRNADSEFAPRSQYWGRILRDLKFSEEQRKNLSDDLERLNAELLAADPRLGEVVTSLGEIQSIMKSGADQSTSIQALPIKPWDLLSKSQVVMKTRGSEIDIPLSRYGQGMQSLAVLFLFQAYLKILLKPTFQQETEAIMALEEPEAHLHPQATRALAANLDKINGQKIISTHSPYFIQEIPFERIRMFRRDGPASRIVYIKRCFTVDIPKEKELIEFCEKSQEKFSYVAGKNVLSVKGKVEESEYRSLCKIYPGHPEIHQKLKNLKQESLQYLNDGDLIKLDTFAKRIRGEILFARGWLLCEGQCEYLLLRYFAELLRTPLDTVGIATIDFQDNGSPGAFVGLAQAFGIPWIIICDNDTEKDKFLTQVKDRGITADECNDLFRPLPGEGSKLESFLYNNGFKEEYKQILAEKNVNIRNMEGTEEFDKEIISLICADKTGNTTALIEHLRSSGADESRVPQFLGDVIRNIIARTEI